MFNEMAHLRTLTEELLNKDKKLEKLQNSFFNIFNNSSDIFLLFSSDGSVYRANPMASSFFGYAKNDFYNKTYKDLLIEESYTLWNDGWKTINKKGSFQGIFVAIDIFGKHIPITVNCVSIDVDKEPCILLMIKRLENDEFL